MHNVENILAVFALTLVTVLWVATSVYAIRHA